MCFHTHTLSNEGKPSSFHPFSLWRSTEASAWAGHACSLLVEGKIEALVEEIVVLPPVPPSRAHRAACQTSNGTTLSTMLLGCAILPFVPRAWMSAVASPKPPVKRWSVPGQTGGHALDKGLSSYFLIPTFCSYHGQTPNTKRKGNGRLASNNDT